MIDPTPGRQWAKRRKRNARFHAFDETTESNPRSLCRLWPTAWLKSMAKATGTPLEPDCCKRCWAVAHKRSRR